jgi:hypothetical protein
MLNSFSDDNVMVSMNYLLELVHHRRWTLRGLYKVSRYGSAALHYVSMLESGHLVCDCMMGTNLGVPCRHIFAILVMTDATFHISMYNHRSDSFLSCHRVSMLTVLRARWLLDPRTDLTAIPGINNGKATPVSRELSKPMGSLHPPIAGDGHETPPPCTRTLDPKVIHHQAMSKLKVVLSHVHTVADLDFVETGLDAIMYVDPPLAHPLIYEYCAAHSKMTVRDQP